MGALEDAYAFVGGEIIRDRRFPRLRNLLNRPDAAGHCHGAEDRRAVTIGIAARQPDITNNIDRPQFAYAHAHGWLTEVTVGKASDDFTLRLLHRQTIDRDGTDQGQRYVASTINKKVTRKIGLPEYRYDDPVARCKSIWCGAVGRLLCGAKAGGDKHQRQGESICKSPKPTAHAGGLFFRLDIESPHGASPFPGLP